MCVCVCVCDKRATIQFYHLDAQRDRAKTPQIETPYVYSVSHVSARESNQYDDAVDAMVDENPADEPDESNLEKCQAGPCGHEKQCKCRLHVDLRGSLGGFVNAKVPVANFGTELHVLCALRRCSSEDEVNWIPKKIEQVNEEERYTRPEHHFGVVVGQ